MIAKKNSYFLYGVCYILLGVGMIAFPKQVMGDNWVEENTLETIFRFSFRSVIDPTTPSATKNVHIVPKDPESMGMSHSALALDYVSNFHFGLHPVRSESDTFYAKYDVVRVGDRGREDNEDTSQEGSNRVLPHFIQITDKRLSKEEGNPINPAGWRLTVSQEDEFRLDLKRQDELNITGQSARLKDTVINMKQVTQRDGRFLENLETAAPHPISDINISPSQPQLVWYANANEGYNTWSIYYGKVTEEPEPEEIQNQAIPQDVKQYFALLEEHIPENKQGVSLYIPKKNKLYSGKYSAVLNWSLEDVPNL
ncbi:WxL domain-containing protein [Vagococcus humatus]|uniref:WxL domain-containing protein n=1 Tax=Vagococcus humatus TaxID=1889241 RepID=A0A3S0GEF0_9ENTE|nr:WxL domain-containing protein [Vagococcus humatus]RST89878.1 hypothetical protein C7P63_02020 [Vagococcus humatus]